jgi:molybdenum cofactor cytidylyltransferase
VEVYWKQYSPEPNFAHNSGNDNRDPLPIPSNQFYPMNLAQALRLNPNTCLGMVGAGGKTSALFQSGRDLLENNPRRLSTVFISVSTHLAYEQISLADHHFFICSLKDLIQLEEVLPEGLILISGPRSTLKDHPNRVTGLQAECMTYLHKIADRRGFPLLIEADGSKRLPLKAPADYEPAIPGFVNHVVVVAGLSGLGKPLNNQWVHRSERFKALTGLAAGEPISAEAVVQVLSHPNGGLRNIPADAGRVVLLNQADTVELQSQAKNMATRLLGDYDGVVVASVNLNARFSEQKPEGKPNNINRSLVYAVHEPVAGIVLAAGGSRRFGTTKQLLPWKGQPLVRHVVQVAAQADLSPLIVVTGESNAEVQAALDGLDVSLIHNPTWQAGQSTSVRAGLQAIPRHVGAAAFLLCDQPGVTANLLRALVETHSHSLAPIVAPLADGQRGNPLLFDQVTFARFSEIRGDSGGRQLLTHYPITWLPWHDSSILLDIDTPEDYQRLLETG